MKPAPSSRLAGVALAAAALSVLASCASTRLDAQWSDPQLANRPLLHGAKVLVSCEAYEPVVKRLCEDDMGAELIARGASVVAGPSVPNSTPGRPVPDADLLAAARAAGATAVWSTAIGTAERQAGSGFSVGLGGFGGGSHVGGGVGVTLPIGQGADNVGYAADARLLDVASGKLAWTARATSPASGDVPKQLTELSRTVMAAADKAGLF